MEPTDISQDPKLKKYCRKLSPTSKKAIIKRFKHYYKATAQSTNYSIRGGTGTVYLASPGTDPIDTGLSSIAGFGFGVVSPTTPDYLVVNCTPGADGTLLCSTTPADATISWIAVGGE